jgi:K+-sensing histidine kinase KdpD
LFSISFETNLIETVSNNEHNCVVFRNNGNIYIKSNRTIKVLEIIVEDSGLGISKKDLNYIKNTFKEETLKINIDRNYNKMGTGIGINICNNYK